MSDEQRDRHALPDSVAAQYAVLEEALDVYIERHRQRGDLWRKYGWRGMLYDVRVCAERAWVRWFGAEPVTVDVRRFGDPEPQHLNAAEHLHVDELLDVINYAAMGIRAIREGNRDGDNWWHGV